MYSIKKYELMENVIFYAILGLSLDCNRSNIWKRNDVVMEMSPFNFAQMSS